MASSEKQPTFGLMMPKSGIKDVPKEVLRPSEAWAANGQTQAEYDKVSKHLATLFEQNFKEFSDKCSASVIAAGPKP